jgi:hypothetical protein
MVNVARLGDHFFTILPTMTKRRRLLFAEVSIPDGTNILQVTGPSALYLYSIIFSGTVIGSEESQSGLSDLIAVCSENDYQRLKIGQFYDSGVWVKSLTITEEKGIDERSLFKFEIEFISFYGG